LQSLKYFEAGERLFSVVYLGSYWLIFLKIFGTFRGSD